MEGIGDFDILVFFMVVVLVDVFIIFFFLLVDFLEDSFFFSFMEVIVVVRDGDTFRVLVLIRDVFFLKFVFVLGFLNFFIGEGLVLVDLLFDWLD